MASWRAGALLVYVATLGALLAGTACGDETSTSASSTTTTIVDPERSQDELLRAEKAKYEEYYDVLREAEEDLPGTPTGDNFPRIVSGHIRLAAVLDSYDNVPEEFAGMNAEIVALAERAAELWDEAIALCDQADADMSRDIFGLPSDGITETCSIERAYDAHRDVQDLLRDLRGEVLEKRRNPL